MKKKLKNVENVNIITTEKQTNEVRTQILMTDTPTTIIAILLQVLCIYNTYMPMLYKLYETHNLIHQIVNEVYIYALLNF